MSLLTLVIEEKIREAIAKGELDQLQGQGQPMDLTEDPFTPEDMRMAYRILKNAGFAPTEVETLNEIAALKDQIAALGEAEADKRNQLTHELRAKELAVRTKIESLKSTPRLK